LQRFRMTSGAATDVPPAIRNALLGCTLNEGTLRALCSALTTHSEAGSPVLEFVKRHGLEALSSCDHAEEHRLVHQVSEIPGVTSRLPCLIVEARWAEDARKCREDLEILHEGLRSIIAKRDALVKFFHTVLRLGNSLNKGGGGAIAKRGFRLSSLSKIAQLRSSSRPQVTLLHMVLALMSPADVDSLCTGLPALRSAVERKSFGVYERVCDLVDGHLGTRTQAASVLPARRWRPGPSGEMVEERDGDDQFHRHMMTFLTATGPEARALAQLCSKVFKTYWELSVFLEDPRAVFPPPQRESDATEDLFVIMTGFTSSVMKSRSGLQTIRDDVAAGCMLPTPRNPETPRDAGRFLRTPRSLPTRSESSSTLFSESRARTTVPCRSASTGVLLTPTQGSQDAVVRRLRDVDRDEDEQSDVSDWGSQSPAARRRLQSKDTVNVARRGGTASAPVRAPTSFTLKSALAPVGSTQKTTRARLQAPDDVSSRMTPPVSSRDTREQTLELRMTPQGPPSPSCSPRRTRFSLAKTTPPGTPPGEGMDTAAPPRKSTDARRASLRLSLQAAADRVEHEALSRFCSD